MSYGVDFKRGGEEPRQHKDVSRMTPQERFDYAKSYKLNLPKGGGRTLNQIAMDDDGLMYLDWLLGQQWVNGVTRTALTNFMCWEDVARDVERIKERRAIQEADKPRQSQQDRDNQERSTSEAPW